MNDQKIKYLIIEQLLVSHRQGERLYLDEINQLAGTTSAITITVSKEHIEAEIRAIEADRDPKPRLRIQLVRFFRGIGQIIING